MSEPLLEVEGLRKRLGPRRVLWDVALRCGAAELLVVTGENGSGKSTLLRCLAGVLDADAGREALKAQGIATEPVDEWAYRSITRDIAWGVPLPDDLDPDVVGKTLYVWPDSLLAPISFTKVACSARSLFDSESSSG